MEKQKWQHVEERKQRSETREHKRERRAQNKTKNIKINKNKPDSEMARPFS